VMPRLNYRPGVMWWYPKGEIAAVRAEVSRREFSLIRYLKPLLFRRVVIEPAYFRDPGVVASTLADHLRSIFHCRAKRRIRRNG
jgi:hypothetical protein